MSDINFLEVDALTIQQELIQRFETALGATFYPGDERRIFLQQLTQVLVGMANSINSTGRQNLLRYASGSKLDAMGEFYDCARLPATKATVILQFTLSAIQVTNITIPQGTRVTPDGTMYFATAQDLIIAAGQINGSVTAEATMAGAEYNGFVIGQIQTIVDPVAYVASVTNTSESSGGSDIETDEDYRDRIQLAPESFSVAGPEGAYRYWAKTASNSIADVTVTSPSAGVVKVIPLLAGGTIPDQTILDAVLAAVSATNRRPLTDNVQVEAPTQVSYDITLTYYLSLANQSLESSIRNAIEGTGGAIDQYKAWQCALLGRAINPDQLRYLIIFAGASRVIITNPVYAAVDIDEVAAVGATSITYGGLE
jgi:phage-related baseplate assembly protein